VSQPLRRAEERRRTESTEDQTSPARRTTADDCIMSLASSAAAAAPVPGVLIRQSPSTLRPSFTAGLLPSGAARPLQATSASRRLPASAVRAQSAADPGYLPESEFYKIEAIVRPWRVPHVSSVSATPWFWIFELHASCSVRQVWGFCRACWRWGSEV